MIALRWVPIIALAFVNIPSAQPLQTRTPPPPGVDISAKDGDRILIDDDARIQIVRRRQATIRTIFSAKEEVLIVLVDYAKPGAFPDGMVDSAFNFYQIKGAWPLGPRWESLTAIYQYHGESSRQNGLAIETPRGLVRLVPRGREASEVDPSTFAVLTYSGAANGPRHNVSFAEAEKMQLNDFVRSKGSGATVGTTMTPDGRVGTAAVAAGVRRGDSPAPQTRTTPPSVAPPDPDAMRQANLRTPPPAGQEITARDGDRVIVDDDARVQIVRRRQATVRSIFIAEYNALIVLADYAKADEIPDGVVDMMFAFYELSGGWPLEPRWEALTTIFSYESDAPPSAGYGLTTPSGLIRLSPRMAGDGATDSSAVSNLWYRGASFNVSRGMTFADAEKSQLAELAKRRSAAAKPAP